MDILERNGAWKETSFKYGWLGGNKCVLWTGLMIEVLENSVFSAPDEAVCWGGGGINPGVAEADGACFVVKVSKVAHEGVSEVTEMVVLSYFLGENVAHVVMSITGCTLSVSS